MSPLPKATGVSEPAGRAAISGRQAAALSRVIAQAAEAARASTRGHSSYVRVRREPLDAATARSGHCVTDLRDSGPRSRWVDPHIGRFEGEPDLPSFAQV